MNSIDSINKKKSEKRKNDLKKTRERNRIIRKSISKYFLLTSISIPSECNIIQIASIIANKTIETKANSWSFLTDYIK